jgi:hypothetical protein
MSHRRDLVPEVRGMIRAMFALVALLVAAPLPSLGSTIQLDQQLAAIHTDTALVYPSQAIDEYPIWSPDGQFLAVNDEGEWRKVDLAKVQLQSAKWREGQVLGVNQNHLSVTSASIAEVAQWQRNSRMQARRVIVGQTVVELRQRNASTELVVTEPGNRPHTRWTSEEENCHSLVVSPDAQHVAFICELNGVLVLRVRK